MCGIIGYVGKDRAEDVVLTGLKRLEYRGYDSAGLTLGGDVLSTYKCRGSVNMLEVELKRRLAEENGKQEKDSADFSQDSAPGKHVGGICGETGYGGAEGEIHLGIGHTRWATHGGANELNAHPHLSPDGTVAIVHNGIIENCAELKEELLTLGHVFRSDTDSEILAHLMQIYLRDGMDAAAAVRATAKKVQGAATFLVLIAGDDRIFCHRRGTALYAGKGDGGCYAASDIAGLSDLAESAYALEDDDIAVLTECGVTVLSESGEVSRRRIAVPRGEGEDCGCFMRKEIAEIPHALMNTCRSFKRFPDECVQKIKNASRIAIFGCGTAFHAGLYGKEAFERIAGKPVDVFVASEADGARFIDGRVFSIFVTQSGETADTLAALDRCKALGAVTLAVTNSPYSSAAFKADYVFNLDAGREVAVAATKSYNCQLLALFLLAVSAAGEKVSYLEVRELVKAATELIVPAPSIDAKNKNLFFIGRGLDRITAREGALKFKEITYKMTDAYPAGELKHGTIALIDGNAAVIVLATDEADKPRLAATVSELKARGAEVLALSAVGDIGADKTFALPRLSEPLTYPILSVIPLQILALKTSCELGLSPDKPRNLAKSVTVI